MDPLSITVSALTLADAATKICQFCGSIRDADKGLDALCTELRTLTSVLKAIDERHKDFRRNPLTLVSIDRDLWEQGKLALNDCQQTLDQLAALIERIKGPSRSKANLFANLLRQTKLATNLHLHSKDVAGFREKIHMSNFSLQTILQVINLSLSFRHDASQEMILKALHELNEHLKQSDRAASDRHATGFLDPADRCIIANLKGLIRAAQSFHSNASSTAGSERGGRRQHTKSFRSQSGYAESTFRSNMPSIRMPSIRMPSTRTPSIRQRNIDMYLVNDSPVQRQYRIPPILPYPDDPEVAEPESQTASDVDIDKTLSLGLSIRAQKAISELNLIESEKRLRQALNLHKAAGLDDLQHRHLRVQLVLCMLLQGSGQEAEDLILDLAEFRINDDVVADHLLYALALAQIHECNFEATIGTCRRLWQATRRTRRSPSLHDHHIWQLIAVSYQESGSEEYARATEEVYPELQLHAPLPTVGRFIANCRDLLAELFGKDEGVDLSKFSHQIQQLDFWSSATSLQDKLAQRNKVQIGIDMNVVEGPDKFLAEPIGPTQTFTTLRESHKRFSRRRVLKRATSLFSRTVFLYCHRRRRRAQTAMEDNVVQIPQEIHELNPLYPTASLEPQIIGRRFSFEGRPATPEFTAAVLSVDGVHEYKVPDVFELSADPQPIFFELAATCSMSMLGSAATLPASNILIQREDSRSTAMHQVPEVVELCTYGRAQPMNYPTNEDFIPELDAHPRDKSVNLPDCSQMGSTCLVRRLEGIHELSAVMTLQREASRRTEITTNATRLTSSHSLEGIRGINYHHITKHAVSPHWDSGYESGSSMSCKEDDFICESLGHAALPFVQEEFQPDPPDQAHQVYRPYRPSQLWDSEPSRTDHHLNDHGPPGYSNTADVDRGANIGCFELQ